ncbi:hypothetical protein [Streptomyces exfoliatus]|nr:hypothetical protein [Streptomyces exfoliatus]
MSHLLIAFESDADVDAMRDRADTPPGHRGSRSVSAPTAVPMLLGQHM